MSNDYFRKLDTVEISKVKQRPGEPPRDDVGVRAYCYTVHSTWLLQVRGYLSLANGSKSDQFVCASAWLNPEALYELRDALDRLIAEHECGPDPVAGIERASDAKLLRERDDAEYTLQDADLEPSTRERLEARRRAIDSELARRARDVEAAEERAAQTRANHEIAVEKLDALIAQLVAVRDAARKGEP